MNKISVIGRPGSGKSYFSKKLAENTGLPLIHLDRIYHELAENLEDVDLSRAMRKTIEEVTSKKRWITDGNYGSTHYIRLPRSDTIIYFDYPLWIVVYRLIKRQIMYFNRDREDMPRGWRQHFNPDFYRKHVLGYKRNPWYPKLIKFLSDERTTKRAVIFKKPRDAQRFLDNLGK